MLFNDLKTKHTFFPVIHLDGKDPLECARRNSEIAENANVAGVFLIEHSGILGFPKLIEVASTIAEEFPDLGIGINCLDIYENPELVFAKLNKLINAVWIDKAGIDKDDCSFADKIREAHLDSGWTGIYFGSVAFKYQKPVPEEDLPQVVELARKYVDVLVTSGSGTGVAADLGKIGIMMRAAKNTPMALASGVSAENVEDYMNLGVKCFMVASSIQGKTFHDLSPVKTKTLGNIIKERA